MANIFRKKDQYIDRVNRSTFDLSFVNNLTMKFGAITPVCCLPVSFGDSFQINARFNLQLLPTVFPIQTQLYVRLHFVYVRTRTIWKDWMSFFGGDESVVPPYVQFGSDARVKALAGTGTLGDYLNLPTTLVGNYALSYSKSGVWSTSLFVANGDLYGFSTILSQLRLSGNTIFEPVGADHPLDNTTYAVMIGVGTISEIDVNSLDRHFICNGKLVIPTSNIGSDDYDTIRRSFFVNIVGETSLAVYSSYDETATVSLSFDTDADTMTVSYSFEFDFHDKEIIDDLLINVGFMRPVLDGQGNRIPHSFLFEQSGNFSASGTYGNSAPMDMTKDTCPYYDGADSNKIRISALPFRVYEAYYNAFGRDVRNNPFMINGKPEYNQYVPSLDGGADNEDYQLHYANWEPDAYTTALQSPQSGIAPLVGITSLGEATFRDAAGNTYTAQLETAEDGDTVTGFQMKSSNAPADVVRNLIGMATSGISISDFRNVNSLQRFLEIRIRQSPRYKNLVKGLFDVDLDYDELMMPEFLGGISDTIPVYKVTQTTPTDGNPLGSFAGQGSLQSGMRHVIRKYCPEDGYILGVMSVVPAANYSQLLPPHFTRMNLLDWHFPQFNNISYQPMLYKNLCPIQAFNNNPSDLNKVFGYQRAYWDLISSFDEVHGEFRGSMRNFVINRVFDQAPELSKDFLLVNPDHVNDVFAMTSENGDKILGSIAFDITKKTTIPRNSIPHIE